MSCSKIRYLIYSDALKLGESYRYFYSPVKLWSITFLQTPMLCKSTRHLDNGIGCISMHKNSINLIALGNGILWIRKNMMGMFKCKFNILPVHSRNCCYIYMKITRFRDLFFIRWAFIYWRLFILKWASLLTNFSHVTLSWRFGGKRVLFTSLDSTPKRGAWFPFLLLEMVQTKVAIKPVLVFFDIWYSCQNTKFEGEY